MSVQSLLLTLLLVSVLAFWLGRRRARGLFSAMPGNRRLHSQPGHYGIWTALWCGLPALLIVLVWSLVDDPLLTRIVLADSSPAEIEEVRLVLGGADRASVDPQLVAAADRYVHLERIGNRAMAVTALAAALAGAFLSWMRIRPGFRARMRVEQAVYGSLRVSSCLVVCVTLGIVLSIVFGSFKFFREVPILDFLFGLHWSPRPVIQAGQDGGYSAFGVLPVLTGSLLIAVIAMLVAAPLGLFSAVYLSEYAGPRFRAAAGSLLEILAGIPAVVYGFFAVLLVAPGLHLFGDRIGLSVAPESALAAGLVIGVMIIPFVCSLAADSIAAVPRSLRDGSLALGATSSETIRLVVVPAARPGIIASLLLAFSRALGETMIVVMVAGLAGNLTANPLHAVTTITVQIVMLLSGDQIFDNPRSQAVFALGLVLFAITLVLNALALYATRAYREEDA
ncbi:MAG: phosphate ABC transporter permease subunit PstC [Desulfobulbus sp.]|jgi:phosphate transport system permease protein